MLYLLSLLTVAFAAEDWCKQIPNEVRTSVPGCKDAATGPADWCKWVPDFLHQLTYGCSDGSAQPPAGSQFWCEFIYRPALQYIPGCKGSANVARVRAMTCADDIFGEVAKAGFTCGQIKTLLSCTSLLPGQEDYIVGDACPVTCNMCAEWNRKFGAVSRAVSNTQCKDDPLGQVAANGATCGQVTQIPGYGCEDQVAGEPAGTYMKDACPVTCGACAYWENKYGSVARVRAASNMCVDDPLGRIAEAGGTCGQIVNYPGYGCDDQIKGEAAGTTMKDACPVTCNACAYWNEKYGGIAKSRSFAAAATCADDPMGKVAESGYSCAQVILAPGFGCDDHIEGEPADITMKDACPMSCNACDYWNQKWGSKSMAAPVMGGARSMASPVMGGAAPVIMPARALTEVTCKDDPWGDLEMDGESCDQMPSDVTCDTLLELDPEEVLPQGMAPPTIADICPVKCNKCEYWLKTYTEEYKQWLKEEEEWQAQQKAQQPAAARAVEAQIVDQWPSSIECKDDPFGEVAAAGFSCADVLSEYECNTKVHDIDDSVPRDDSVIVGYSCPVSCKLCTPVARFTGPSWCQFIPENYRNCDEGCMDCDIYHKNNIPTWCAKATCPQYTWN